MDNSKNILLETERLYIQPLTIDQLLNYIKLNYSLEESLGLQHYPRTLPDELKDALEQSILPQVSKSGIHFLYYTLWTIVDIQNKYMVGDLCFKGLPNTFGEIEIGYGIYPDFHNKGFMTEALGAISRWAFNQPGVQSILAETDCYNLSSHKTLSKNGFIVYKQIENMMWWRLDNK